MMTLKNTLFAILAVAAIGHTVLADSTEDLVRDAQTQVTMDSDETAEMGSAAVAWRTFHSRYNAYRFADRKSCQGYWTNVFYDASRGWWVVEYF